MTYGWFSTFMEPRGSGGGAEWYLKELRDPLWRAKSLKIKERDDWTCRKCGRIDRPLQVHHKGYFPNRKPWEYPDEVLVTLCDLCHYSTHEFSMLPENFEWFLHDSPLSLICAVCEMRISVEQASGRFGKNEPICESCCTIMEERRIF